MTFYVHFAQFFPLLLLTLYVQCLETSCFSCYIVCISFASNEPSKAATLKKSRKILMTNKLIDPRIVDRNALALAPDLLTADTLAPLLNVSRSTLYSLMRTDTFPVLQVGKRKFVKKSHLMQWLDSYTQEVKS